MTVETIRPNGTVQQGGWTLVGTSVHGALSDDSASTYLSASAPIDAPDGAVFTFADLIITAGARILAVRQRWRVSAVGLGFFRGRWSLDGDAPGPLEKLDIGAVGPDTFALPWRTERPGGGEWTVADVDVLRVRMHLAEADDDVFLSEHYVDVEYEPPPTLTITAPTSPVTDTSKPAVQWTLDADQEAYELRLYTSGQQPGGVWPDDPDDIPAEPVYDTGVQLTPPWRTIHNVTMALDDGETYTAYVRARREWGTPDFWSAWDNHSFLMDLDAPDPPVVTVTAEHDAGRVKLDIADAATSNPAADWFVIDYRDDGQWRPLRFGQKVPAGTVYDHEAPLHTSREYRVFGVAQVNASEAFSDATVETAVLTSNERWLTDVQDPDRLHAAVKVQAHDRSLVGRDTVHLPVGRPVATVTSDLPTVEHRLQLVSLAPSAHDVIMQALEDRRTLRFRDRREASFVRLVQAGTRTQVSWDGASIDRWQIVAVEVAEPDVS